MREDDYLLITTCVKGDASKREAFVRRYSNLIYSTILNTARIKGAPLSQQDTEDLHQTIFLKLFEKNCRKLKQYRGDNGCTLASWIRKISVNECLSYFRKKKDLMDCPEKSISIETLFNRPAETPSAFEHLANRDRWRIFETALKMLLPREQIVIRMNSLENIDLRIVAELLNITPNNLYTIKHRATKRLKSAIEQRLETV